MNIVIDLGNSRSKIAFFDGERIIDLVILEKSSFQEIIDKIEPYKDSNLILSSVVELTNEFLNNLKRDFNLTLFNHKTPSPVTNCYETPESLGIDRLGAVIGAHAIYPQENVLVIDSGTAITYEVLNNNGEYLGGAISPGLETRFKALHTFTDNLPLLSSNFNIDTIGRNTADAIKSGVTNGFIDEIDGQIDRLRIVYNINRVIVTGGNATYLHKKLKNTIFAIPNLVLIGLNEVLKHNS